MDRKKKNRSQSDLTETGIFVFLTMVIFFGAVGFPTLINTQPTFGYDQNTIQRLTPVTSYYQQAFAQEISMNILGNYDYNPMMAYLILPSIPVLPPPDIMQYFTEKYKNLEIENGLIQFDPIQKLSNIISESILPPAFADVSTLTGTFHTSRSTAILGTSCPSTAEASTTGDARLEYDSSTLIGKCQVTSFEFDISSIPDDALITDVDLLFSTSLATGATFPCDFKSMEKQPSVSSQQVIYDDVLNGTTFVSASGLCFPTGSGKTLDLGVSADADLQANLLDDWWGVGIHRNGHSRDPTNYFSIFGTTQLQVTYTVPPSPITDLQARIQNETLLFSTSQTTARDINKFPVMVVQVVTPSGFTNPVLIDSLKWDSEEVAPTTGLPDGIVHGIIIGDRTGSLTTSSLSSNIFFIENSTNSYPTTAIGSLLTFNFSGNTILDSNDNKVGVGIYVTSNDNRLRMGFGAGGSPTLPPSFPIISNQGMSNGWTCLSDTTTFKTIDCGTGFGDHMADFDIFGGDGRAILNWTAPYDGGSAITGYSIKRTNATQIKVFNEGQYTETATTEQIGTDASPLGIIGQRITFPNDVLLTAMELELDDYLGTVPIAQGTVQGVVVQGSAGTSTVNRIANSTAERSYFLGNGIGAPSNPSAIYTGNAQFGFNNTLLKGGTEYIIGLEVLDGVGATTPCAPTCVTTTASFSTLKDPNDAIGHVNSGLGVLTEKSISTSDLWEDTTGQEWNANLIGLNYTDEIGSTGNTNTEYTSTADFPTADRKINAYSYLVEAINGGGTADPSNFVEISPDRSDSIDSWQYKEQDERTLFIPNCEFSDATTSPFGFNMTAVAGAIGGCYFFKSFDKDLMTGSDVRIDFRWQTAETLPAIFILDGSLDKDNPADFVKTDAFKLKGAGYLNATYVYISFPTVANQYCTPTGGSFPKDCSVIIPASQINYGSSTEDKITFFVDNIGSASSGNKKMQINYVSIENIGSWNFTQNPRLIKQVNQGASTETVYEFNEDDRGIVQSNSIFNGTVTVIPEAPATIDDLQVFPISNSIFMNWTEPAGSPTSYLIERTDGRSRLGSDDFLIYHQGRASFDKDTQSAGTEFAIAQEITPTIDVNVTRIDMTLIQANAGCSGSGVMRGGIWSSSGSTLIASSNDTVSPCSFPLGVTSLSPDDKSFFFDPPVKLDGGTTYHIGANMTGTVTNTVSIYRTASDEVSGLAKTAPTDTFPYSFASVGGDLGMIIYIENFTNLATISSSFTNFTDTGLEDGLTYFYRVRGSNDVGVAVNGSNIAFTKEPVEDTVDSATFSDDFTSYVDQTAFDTAYPIDTFGGGGNRVKGNPSTDLIDFQVQGSDTGDNRSGLIHDFGSGFVSDSQWTLRGKITITSNTPADINYNDIFIGMGDTISSDLLVTQDFIGFNLHSPTGTASYNIIDTDGAFVNISFDSTFSRTFANEVLYTEIKRTSPLTYEVSLFQDPDFTVLLEKEFGTSSSATTDLRYFKIMSRDQTNAGSIVGTFNDLQFWNGVTPLIDNGSPRWYYREVDNYPQTQAFPFDPVMDFTTTGSDHVKIDSGGGVASNGFFGEGIILKSFNKTDIFGSDITVGWSGIATGGSPTTYFIQILDGAYNTENNPDFPLQDGYFEVGGGVLGSTGFVSDGFTNTFTTLTNSSIAWGTSTQDFVTVIIGLDDSAGGGYGLLDINNVTISNIGTYNFDSGNTVTNLRGNTESPIEDIWDAGYYDDGAFTVTATPLNATQTESDFSAVTEQVVITSPPFPITTLSGSTVSNTCQLSWTAPSDGNSPINGYKILRQATGEVGFSVLVSNTTTTSTTYTDTGLVNNIIYQYDVRGLNEFGDAEGSNIDDCQPVVGSVPNEPTNLQASEESNGDVTLTWNEPATGDPTGYRVERKIGEASWTVLSNDTGTTSLTYLDSTTNPATEYSYRVAGWNAFGLDGYSNEGTLTTSSPPQAPILSAVQNVNQIDLSWVAPFSDNPINGYKIEKRINFGSFSVLVANTTTTATTYSDFDLVKPNTYGYRIRALSSAGEGTVSNVVDVIFGSHVVVQVREQDGSGFKGGGLVKAFNSTFSEQVGLNSNSNAIFNNFDVGDFNYTFFDNSNFILNKTFNFPFPSGNLTSTFTIEALVFDVDCPANGAGTDVRIKVNYTDNKDIFSFPSTPVCDSSDQVSWTTRWVGENVTDTSIMVADFISTIFKANAEQFLASANVIPTTYSSGNNAITSSAFQVNATDVTINFNLFLGRAPAGGGSGSGGQGSGDTTPPSQAIPTKEVILGNRLTGLSLLSRTHQFAKAGDIIEGTVSVNWEGEENLSVKQIDTSGSDLDIRFDQTPFLLDQKTEGIGEFAKSSAEIPYKIVLPADECNPEMGITQNCFDLTLHTLPIQFKFGLGDQEYEASTEVFVDGRPVPLDIVQLQIILLFLVLIASAVFGRFIRNRLRKPVRRTAQVKKKFKKKFDSS